MERGRSETSGVRARSSRLSPASVYDACEKVATTISSLSLVRYRLNNYSVPGCFGHREVIVRSCVHEVEIACRTQVTRVPHKPSS